MRLGARIVMSLFLLGALSASLAAAEAARAAAPGVFVAVGYGGFRGWSVDGRTWNAERWSAKNEDDVNIIFSVAYRAGVFVCAGGGSGRGFILRSTDGRAWQEVVTTKWRIAPVAALPGGFISVFDDRFQHSLDGVAWTPAAEAKVRLSQPADGWHSGYFRRWAVGDGAVVFAGDYALPGGVPRVGWIGGTRDGATPLGLQRQDADVCGLAYGKGRFVACTKDGALLASADGLGFAPAGSSGDRHGDACLRFHQGAFWLRGEMRTVTSVDGIAWAPVAKPPRIPRAVAPDGTAIDCGWGGIEVSADGIAWAKATVPIDATGICAVAHGVPLADLPALRPARARR